LKNDQVLSRISIISDKNVNVDYWCNRWHIDFISVHLCFLRSHLLDQGEVFHKVLVLNCNLMFFYQDLTQVGFFGKKSAINRARRLRKVGDKLPPPYPNGWFAITDSSEIKSGTAKSVNCLGENLVVFRSTNSNEVFVFDAYCPLSGVNLGVSGIIDGDCIECPFHQWKFSGSDGSCVEIPYSGGLENS
jgi:nitrite reductase/ring-hydroxylating ferredoxin subunit